MKMDFKGWQAGNKVDHVVQARSQHLGQRSSGAREKSQFTSKAMVKEPTS